MRAIRALAALCLGLGGASLAVAASPADRPKVVVLVVAQDAWAAKYQGALEAAAETELQRSTRVAVVPIHDALNPEAAQVRVAKLREAREKLAQGKQALEDLDANRATQVFSAAVGALRETDVPSAFGELRDALVMKAAAHATAGDNELAKKAIDAVVAVAPDAEFSPSYFPPELIKYAQQQKKAAATARGELLVRTEPPGARVWVDGRAHGISPVTVPQLPQGRHYVTVSRGGYALSTTLETVGEQVISLPAAELSGPWKRAVSEMMSEPQGPQRDVAAQELGRAAHVDQVLVVLAKKSLVGDRLDLAAVRVAVADGRNLGMRSATISPRDTADLEALFTDIAQQRAQSVEHTASQTGITAHAAGSGSSTQRMASIALIGVGVAALVSGVSFGVMASDDAAAFRRTPQLQTVRSEAYAAQGRTYSIVADVSYLLALAAGATGGVLLFTNHSPATPPPVPPAADEPRPTRREGEDLRNY